jgi:hypothetical protein
VINIFSFIYFSLRLLTDIRRFTALVADTVAEKRAQKERVAFTTRDIPYFSFFLRTSQHSSFYLLFPLLAEKMQFDPLQIFWRT